MKTKLTILISAAALLALPSGCSKQEPAAPAADVQKAPEPMPSAAKMDQATPAPAPATQQAIDAAAEQAKAQAAALQSASDKAAADAKAQADALQKAGDKAAADAQAGAAALTAKTQTLIETVQKYLADKNWSEALKSLTELGSLKLTPEQQATVATLKQQAQKMAQDAATSKAADQAGKAVGDLLKKK